MTKHPAYDKKSFDSILSELLGATEFSDDTSLPIFLEKRIGLGYKHVPHLLSDHLKSDLREQKRKRRKNLKNIHNDPMVKQKMITKKEYLFRKYVKK